MSGAWIGVAGTAVGAALGWAGTLLTAYLQRRWGNQDREAELARAAVDAVRTSQLESDAVAFRKLKPSLDKMLAHRHLTVTEEGEGYNEAAVEFAEQYRQTVLIDPDSQRLVAVVFACMLRHHAEITALRTLRSQLSPGPKEERIAAQEQAVERATEDFERAYRSLTKHMAEYVGMHRLEA